MHGAVGADIACDATWLIQCHVLRLHCTVLKSMLHTKVAFAQVLYIPDCMPDQLNHLAAADDPLQVSSVVCC